MHEDDDDDDDNDGNATRTRTPNATCTGRKDALATLLQQHIKFLAHERATNASAAALLISLGDVLYLCT